MNNNGNNGQPFDYTYEGYVPEERKYSTVALFSMVSGICSIVLFCCCAGVACGIIAVVLAIVDRKEKGRFSGFAVAGLICGLIGIALGIAIAVLAFFYSDILTEIASDPMNFINN